MLALLKHVPVGVRGQHDRAVTEQVLDVLEREAPEWRRSWKRLRGSPERTKARWKARVTEAAWSGVPMVVVNT